MPIRRLAALSTTQLPHLELLDSLENLVAVSDIEVVHSPGINQRFAAGNIAEIGHGAGVNLELVLELDTDVVMTAALAQSQYNAHPVLAASRRGRGHQRRVYRAVAPRPHRMAQIHRGLF